MKYGYGRVSTLYQQKEGNGLEVQKNLLLAEGCLEENIVLEKYSSNGARPKFKMLLEKLQEGDTLIVTKLDRLSRSVHDGIELVNSLTDKGVRVHILNMGILDNSPAGKLIRNIFLTFAEFERDIIRERTQEGKAIARTKEGFRDGRPVVHGRKKMELAMQLLETKTIKEVSRTLQVSESTIKRYKRKKKEELENKQTEIDQV